MDPDVSDWLAVGTELLLAQRGDPSAPSLLPGWSRAHVLTHVARNADALGNLLTWARTGVETPMYAGAAERQADIESGVGRPAAQIQADVADTARRLGEQLASMTPETWSATVRTARGRQAPASVVPWLRIREVWIHAIDLDTGATFADLPHDLALRMLAEVTDSFKNRPCPAFVLHPTDADTTFNTRPHVSCATPVVTRTTAELLRWATGRGGSDLPALPSWL